MVPAGSKTCLHLLCFSSYIVRSPHPSQGDALTVQNPSRSPSHLEGSPGPLGPPGWCLLASRTSLLPTSSLNSVRATPSAFCSYNTRGTFLSQDSCRCVPTAGGQISPPEIPTACSLTLFRSQLKCHLRGAFSRHPTEPSLPYTFPPVTLIVFQFCLEFLSFH